MQFVIPKGRPAALSLVPTDDAYVTAGANQRRNYGLSASLNTALTPTASQSSTTATFLKFAVNRVRAGQVRCICQLPWRLGSDICWLTSPRALSREYSRSHNTVAAFVRGNTEARCMTKPLTALAGAVSVAFDDPSALV